MVFSWFKKKPRAKQPAAKLIRRPSADITPEDLAPIPRRDHREALEKMGGAEEVATMIRSLLAEDQQNGK